SPASSATPVHRLPAGCGGRTAGRRSLPAHAFQEGWHILPGLGRTTDSAPAAAVPPLAMLVRPPPPAQRCCPYRQTPRQIVRRGAAPQQCSVPLAPVP